jgi:serine/threonine-protein kinase
MDRAIDLDPVSPVLYRDLGIVHYLHGEFLEAERALNEAERLDPGFRGSLFWRGRTFAELGRLEDALEMFQARWKESGANTRVLASLVHTLGLMNRRSEALDYFEQLQREAAAGRVPPLNLAIAHLGLGQHDRAVMLLERAYGERAIPLYQLGVDPVYVPVRNSARIRAILLNMNLNLALRSRS